MSAVPQVRPAPKPLRMASWPGLSWLDLVLSGACAALFACEAFLARKGMAG
jgi:hypothetical protein